MVGFEFLKTFLIYGVLFLASVTFTIYLYFQYSYTYWGRRRIPHLKPKFPFGNNDGIGPGAVSYGIESVEWHNTLKRQGHKFGGAWSWAKPVLVLTDPEYVKDILLKHMASFTIDVIGCIAFGLEAESFKEGSKFRQMGKDIFSPSFTKSIEIIISRAFEKTAQNIGITNVPKHITEFFTDVVKTNIDYRRKNNIKRPDFTQLLMEIQETTKNDLKPFDFDELIANTIIFFFAGFDTSSITMTMAIYELSRNPKLQKKTRYEINEVLKKYKGELTYDGFQEMTYLRQVVDEILRLYTPVPTLSRIAVKSYKFRDTNFTLKKGTPVVISAMGLGRDPSYFPEPEKFDPERFSTENKSSINAYAYLPFGEGPRNCIGMRFGIMQASIGLIRILQNFELDISSLTKMPLTLKKGSFSLQTNEVLYVKARKVK